MRITIILLLLLIIFSFWAFKLHQRNYIWIGDIVSCWWTDNARINDVEEKAFYAELHIPYWWLPESSSSGWGWIDRKDAILKKKNPFWFLFKKEKNYFFGCDMPSRSYSFGYYEYYIKNQTTNAQTP